MKTRFQLTNTGYILTDDRHTVEVRFTHGWWLRADITIDGSTLYYVSSYTQSFEDYIQAIQEWDENKLAFMYELAKSGLNPEREWNFDWEKLRRAIKISRGVKDALHRYREIFDREVKPNHIIRIGEVVLAFNPYRVCYSDEVDFIGRGLSFFYGWINPVSVGKAIYKGKITKTLRSAFVETTKDDFLRCLKHYLGNGLNRLRLRWLGDDVYKELVKDRLMM